MNIDTVINQIKANAPLFAGNVAGAADFAMARDQVWLKPPAAYVVPLDDDGSENRKKTGLYQDVTETVMVMVQLDNSLDRRGQAAASVAVSDVKAALFGAMLNWRPPDLNCAQGFRYARGGLVGDPDRARLFWQFDFSIDVVVTDADGFQLAARPLTTIQGTVPDASGGPSLVFAAAIPQP